MSTVLVIFALRHAVFFVCTAIAVVMWMVGGFRHVPWITGLVGSVVVGCAVMTAKGPQRPINTMAAIALMIVLDGLLVLGLVKLGFTAAFMAWGIAHLAGVVTSSVMILGAQGAAMGLSMDSSPGGGGEEEIAAWVASRGIVIGLGSAIATVMCGGI